MEEGEKIGNDLLFFNIIWYLWNVDKLNKNIECLYMGDVWWLNFIVRCILMKLIRILFVFWFFRVLNNFVMMLWFLGDCCL